MAEIRYFVRFSKVFLVIFVRFSNDAKGSFPDASVWGGPMSAQKMIHREAAPNRIIMGGGQPRSLQLPAYIRKVLCPPLPSCHH